MSSSLPQRRNQKSLCQASTDQIRALWLAQIEQGFSFCRQWISNSVSRVNYLSGAEGYYVTCFLKELKNLTQVFVQRINGNPGHQIPIAFLSDVIWQSGKSSKNFTNKVLLSLLEFLGVILHPIFAPYERAKAQPHSGSL